jgi:hypothetical protein
MFGGHGQGVIELVARLRAAESAAQGVANSMQNVDKVAR